MNQQQQKMFVWIGGGLIIGILSLTLLSPPQNEEAQKWTALPKSQRADYQRLRITWNSQEHEIDISTTPPKWTAQNSPLQTDQIERLIDEMINLNCGRLLKGQTTEYGLDTPQWILSLEGDTESIVVKVGHKSSLSNHHYVDCDELGGPRLSQYALTLPDKFTDFINPQMISLKPQSIQSIRLYHDQSLQLIEGLWQLPDPQHVNMDAERIQEWLETVYAMKGDEWLKSPRETDHQILIFDDGTTKQEILLGNTEVQNHAGDWFSLSSSDIEQLRWTEAKFYSSRLLLRRDIPLSISLTLGEQHTEAQFESEWNDGGALWRQIETLNVSRSYAEPTPFIGQLTLQYADMEQYKWDIGEGEAHYIFQSPNETVRLHAPKSDLILPTVVP